MQVVVPEEKRFAIPRARRQPIVWLIGAITTIGRIRAFPSKPQAIEYRHPHKGLKAGDAPAMIGDQFQREIL